MARVTDLESILDEIKSALQHPTRGVNAKITAITLEKAPIDEAAGVVVTLPLINDAAYSLQSLNDKAMAYDPFILYGLDDPRAEGIGPATAKKYKFTVTICASDSGQDLEMSRRMFRYSRALEETMEGYFAGIRSGFKLSVESLAPIAFTLQNTSNDYRAVGVSITVGIA